MSLFRNKNEKTQAANPEWTGCHLTVPSGPGSPAAGHPGSEADRLSAETGLLFPSACGASPRGAEKPNFAFSSVPRDAAQPSRHTDSERLTKLPVSKAAFC